MAICSGSPSTPEEWLAAIRKGWIAVKQLVVFYHPVYGKQWAYDACQRRHYPVQ